MADACAGAQRDCQPRHPTRRLSACGDLPDVARGQDSDRRIHQE
jgi:hypothetical protein